MSSIPSGSQDHIWIEGDKQWSWTSCVWRRRKNGQLRFAGIGPEGCSAKSGAGFENHKYLKFELSYPVYHLFVCIFGASFNQPLLFSTSTSVWDSLGLALHAQPAKWETHVQILGKVAK